MVFHSRRLHRCESKPAHTEQGHLWPHQGQQHSIFKTGSLPKSLQKCYTRHRPHLVPNGNSQNHPYPTNHEVPLVRWCYHPISRIFHESWSTPILSTSLQRAGPFNLPSTHAPCVRGRSYELSTWYSMLTLYLVVSYHIPPPPLIYRLSSGWSYLWMFYDVLRCSINCLYILLVTIVTGRLWWPMGI